MRKRKAKKGDLPTAVAVLIAIPFLMNPDKASSALNSLLGLVFILLTVCAIGYGIYWFLSKNTRQKEDYKTNPSAKRRPKTNSSNYNSNSSGASFHNTYEENRKSEDLPKVWSKELIKTLEWKRFEELCSAYFNAKGYDAKVTKQGADGGIDIQLFKANYSTTKAFGIVQCKAWNSYKVGVKPIRELYGVMSAESAPLAIFITSGLYTKEAEEFSNGKHIKLITGDLLLELIQTLPEEKQLTLLNQITTGDYTTPSCPSCDIKMTQRTSKKGNNIGSKFWGCINFPRCRSTLHIKNKA